MARMDLKTHFWAPTPTATAERRQELWSLYLQWAATKQFPVDSISFVEE